MRPDRLIAAVQIMRALGLSYRAIADRLGISETKVQYLLHPERYERILARSRRVWQECRS